MLQILPASSKDARAIKDVFYKTWLATYPNAEAGITRNDIEDWFKDDFSEEKIREMSERIERLANEKSFLVAWSNDKIVGVCRIVRRPEYNQLQAIYVLPEYQGKGVGTALWHEAQKNLEKDKHIVIEVAAYNAKAISFYEKLGFKREGDIFLDETFKMKSGNIIPQIRMRLVKLTKQ